IAARTTVAVGIVDDPQADLAGGVEVAAATVALVVVHERQHRPGVVAGGDAVAIQIVVVPRYAAVGIVGGEIIGVVDIAQPSIRDLVVLLREDQAIG